MAFFNGDIRADEIIVTTNPSGNSYISFGSTSGDAGYGFRDNQGNIQVKNQYGGWNDVVNNTTNSFTLANLGDVLITTTPSNLALLQYDSDLGKWVPNIDITLGGNLVIHSNSNLAETTTANLVVLNTANIATLDLSNLRVYGNSNLAETTTANLVVLDTANIANLFASNSLTVYGNSNLAETTTANLVVLSGANIATLDMSNLQVYGNSNLAETTTSNLVVLSGANIATLDVSNLQVYGNSNLSETTTANLVVLSGANIATLDVSNLRVYGNSNLTETTTANLVVLSSANINSLGVINDIAILVGKLYMHNLTTYIDSGNVSNLDINAITGNVNINANSDIIMSTNTITSGIKMIGTSGQMLVVNQPDISNIYLNFGALSGETGYGLRDNNGTLQVKNLSGGPTDWSALVSRLDNLENVSLSNTANNEIIAFDSGSNTWTNRTVDSLIDTLGYYGSFFDTTTQYSSTQSADNIATLNTVAEAKGVIIVNNSNVTVDYPGVYNFQYSVQVENSASGTHSVSFWMAKNGVILSNSTSVVTLSGNHARALPAWNYVLTMASNDYINLHWCCTTSNNITLHHDVAAINPTRPEVPSIIMTVTPVQYIQQGTLSLGDLLNVSTSGQTANSVLQYNTTLNRWDTRANITLDTPNQIKLGTTAALYSATNGNLTINSSNLDILVTGEAHVHNNLRVTGNIFLDGNYLSNISGTSTGNMTIAANNIVLTGSNLVTCTNNLNVGGSIYKNGNLAVGGPAFSVYASSGVSCASGSTVKMPLNTKEYDTGTCFNNTAASVTLNGLTVPSYSFMPNIPGYYQINGHVSVSAFVGMLPGIIVCNINKNNVEYKQGNRSIVFATMGQGISSVVSSLVYLNGTSDYLDLRFLQASGSTETTDAGSVFGPYFNGCFMHGPIY